MLDARTEKTLGDATEKLRAAAGSRLQCVALYGSAAGSDYVAGSSDLNLVAVVDGLGPELLAALRPHVARWRRQRVATPLLLDERFLDTAVDVFPMELHEIQAQHRILFGNDVFSRLEISDVHLRYQCEHEARGKLLRLRELYLEVGAQRRSLRELLLGSLKTFLIVMRNLNRMHSLPEAPAFDDVLQAFCRSADCSLPTFSRLLDIKLSRHKWEGDEESLFRAYLEEVGILIRVIDTLHDDTDAALSGQKGGTAAPFSNRSE